MDEVFKTLSDEELIHHFIEEGALTRKQAQKAVSYRYLYLIHIFHFEHTPLRKGREGCLRWNPHTEQFEKL